jgi:hypothetical protein
MGNSLPKTQYLGALRIHVPSSTTCTPGIENISIHMLKLALTYALQVLAMYLFAPWRFRISTHRGNIETACTDRGHMKRKNDYVEFLFRCAPCWYGCGGGGWVHIGTVRTIVHCLCHEGAPRYWVFINENLLPDNIWHIVDDINCTIIYIYLSTLIFWAPAAGNS